MKIIIDIDQTILKTTGTDYSSSEPILDNIKKMNMLYEAGHHITYYTARGSVTGLDWRELTENQLKKSDIKYHKLLMKKPDYDLFIDDKCVNIIDFMKESFNLTKFERIEKNE
jgi:hypothetical protein